MCEPHLKRLFIPFKLDITTIGIWRTFAKSAAGVSYNEHNIPVYRANVKQECGKMS